MISSLSFDADSYDIPKPAVHIANESLRVHHGYSRQSILSTSSTATSLLLKMDDTSYDVPRPSSNLGNSRMTPSSSNSSLLTSDSLSLSFSSSNRSSFANMTDYDVPRKFPNATNKRTLPPQSQSIFSLKSIDLGSETYDVPSPSMNSSKRIEVSKELPLEYSSALDTLCRLQNEATVGVTKLLSFVNAQWRTREKLEPVLMDIKLAVVRLKTSLHDLAEFAEGALGNALKTEDKSKRNRMYSNVFRPNIFSSFVSDLSIKLRPLVKALKDADILIHEACNALDVQWNVELLSRVENSNPKQKQSPDSLDQLIVVSQTLTEDIRQTASFIQGNASLLFKRNALTPSTPVSQVQWPEDSDYVCLESEEQFAKKNAEVRNALPKDLKNNFDKVVKSALHDSNEPLDPNDKSVLVYYASQCVTHINYLTQAIDSFLKTVEHNQPPKFFLAYGKFVVLR